MIRNLILSLVVITGLSAQKAKTGKPVVGSDPVNIAQQKKVNGKTLDAAEFYAQYIKDDNTLYHGNYYSSHQVWYDVSFTIKGILAEVQTSKYKVEDVHVFLKTGATNGIMLSIPPSLFDLSKLSQDCTIKAHVTYVTVVGNSNPAGGVRLTLRADTFEVIDE